MSQAYCLTHLKDDFFNWSMYVDWILGTRKRREKKRNIFSLFWLTQRFWFWKYHFEWVMLFTILYAVFPRKDIHTYNSKIVFTQFFLQNIKNKQIRTTTNPPVTPHGLRGNVQTLRHSTLSTCCSFFWHSLTIPSITLLITQPFQAPILWGGTE